MSVLVLLLVVQLVTQLDGVIAQGDTVEGRPKRSQRDELQQCLDSGVADFNETNLFCGNQIAIKVLRCCSKSTTKSYSSPRHD